MRTIRMFSDIVWTLINITTFAIMVGILILVFFYPETFGVIVGQITKGFNQGLQ